jgi:hypothetical protein
LLSGRAIIDGVNPFAVVITTAGLSLLAAGCGGSTATQSSTSSSAASAQQDGAIAFSRCMRSNGVPKFPDPDSGGRLPKVNLQRLGVSSSRLQFAQSGCQHLLPTNDIEASVTQCLSTGDCPPALLQQILNEGLQFARCMRAHGVPNWPDPTRDRDNGAPVFDLLALHGTDWDSPQIENKLDECQRVYSPGVRVGLRR